MNWIQYEYATHPNKKIHQEFRSFVTGLMSTSIQMHYFVQKNKWQ